MIYLEPGRLDTPGGWKWYDPIYKTNFLLLACPYDTVGAHLDDLVDAQDGGAGELNLLATLKSDRAFGDLGPGTSGRHYGLRHPEYGTVCAIWIDPSIASAIRRIGVIAHEALHATWWVLEHKGMTLSDASEEAFTYYQEWIVTTILDRLTEGKEREADRVIAPAPLAAA